MARVIQYLYGLLIALDQLANAILAGDPDETLSSRCGKRAMVKGCWLCLGLCWLLGLMHRDHCLWAIEYDEGKRHE